MRKDRIKKQLITILILLSLFSTLFSFSSTASKSNFSSFNGDSLNGYIIEFEDEPLSVFKTRFKDFIKNIFVNIAETVSNRLLNENVTLHKEKILSVQETAKRDILDILGNDRPLKNIISKTFTNVFNGFFIKDVSESIIEKIKKLPYVKNVYSNQKIIINLDESIPVINADDAWQFHDSKCNRITGEGVKIALLDTGVDYTHPDLKDSYKGGYDFVNNDNDPMDDNGHGTHCAGIALGNGKALNYKYVGVAPEADLYMYKVLNYDGEGTSSSLLDGLEQAVEEDVDIISISAGSNEPGSPDDVLSLAVDNAVESGVVVVVAAGNNGDGSMTISSPGTSLKAITVGSRYKNGGVSYTSSRGPVYYEGTYYTKPDVVAPGVSIKSTINGPLLYSFKSGTSMATPHVAGAAALMLQVHPDWSPEQVKTVLMDNAIDLGEEANAQGNGSIDVSASLKLDQDVIIKVPYIIGENEYFRVKITDNNSNPINAIVIFFPRLRLPRVKYGSSARFRTPFILNPLFKKLESRIIILKISSELKFFTTTKVLNKKSIFQ